MAATVEQGRITIPEAVPPSTHGILQRIQLHVQQRLEHRVQQKKDMLELHTRIPSDSILLPLGVITDDIQLFSTSTIPNSLTQATSLSVLAARSFFYSITRRLFEHIFTDLQCDTLEFYLEGTVSVLTSRGTVRQSPEPAPSRGRSPNNNYPADLQDVDGWVGYGIYLLLVFLAPLIIGALLFFVLTGFCCLRFCGLCGGFKPLADSPYQTKGFSTLEQKIMILPTTIVFLCILYVIELLFDCF